MRPNLSDPSPVADPPDAAAPKSKPVKPRRTHRKATLDSLRVAKEAEQFAGLPDGIKHHLQLTEALGDAAPLLDIGHTVLRLIQKLAAYTQPKDWEPGHRPIVWPSNDNLARCLGLTEDGVSKLIRAAVRAGLITMKDSPTRQRFGKRGKDGHIIQAVTYGFDLSPLAMRYAEIKETATKHQAMIRARAGACRRISIGRAAILQSLEAADGAGLWASGFETLQTRLEALALPRRHSGLTLAEAEHFAERLAALQDEARALFEAASTNPSVATTYAGKNPSAPIVSSEPLNTTTPTSSDKKHVAAIRESSRGQAQNPPSAPEPAAGADTFPTLAINQFQLLDACPTLKSAVWQAEPSWGDVAEACANSCGRYGISKDTWRDARAELGIIGSIVAYAVAISLPADRITHSRGAYFGGMLKKHANGQLNLHGSYFGMLARTRQGQSAEILPPKKSATSDTLPRGMGPLGSLAGNAVFAATAARSDKPQTIRPDGSIDPEAGTPPHDWEGLRKSLADAAATDLPRKPARRPGGS